MKDLQERIKVWHRNKFHDATLERIGLKLGEESGEVQQAIDRIIYAKSPVESERWLTNLTDEIGDVVIVLLALCAKGGIDFEETVRHRAEEVMNR